MSGYKNSLLLDYDLLYTPHVVEIERSPGVWICIRGKCDHLIIEKIITLVNDNLKNDNLIDETIYTARVFIKSSERKFSHAFIAGDLQFCLSEYLTGSAHIFTPCTKYFLPLGENERYSNYQSFFYAFYDWLSSTQENRALAAIHLNLARSLLDGTDITNCNHNTIYNTVLNYLFRVTNLSQDIDTTLFTKGVRYININT